MKKLILIAVAFLSATPARLLADGPIAGARFLALGDSYTVGTAVGPHDGWPWQLAELLRKNNVPCEDPFVIAEEGWSAEDLVAGIDAAKPQGPYDLVTVMIGVNNQFRGGTLDAYRRQLGEVFKRALAAAENDPHRVIGLTIPDYGVTPFARNRDPKRIAAEIGRFNRVFYEEAHKRGIRVVNVTRVSSFARTNPTLVAEDGLHPSPRLHNLWAHVVFPYARSAIQPNLGR